MSEYEPYFGWCDVEGCPNEGSSGGSFWRESGYWTICYQHGRDAVDKPQPQMKARSVYKESLREPGTGYLPTTVNEMMAWYDEYQRCRGVLEEAHAILIRTEDIQLGGAEDKTYLRDVDALRRRITRLLNPPVEVTIQL